MYIEIPLENDMIFQRKMGMTEHTLHMHDSLEITILQESKGTFRVLGRDYDGSPGDVFLIRPFEPHLTLKQEPDHPTKRIMLLFSPAAVLPIADGYRLLAPFYAADLASPLILAHTLFARNIQLAAELAVREQEKRMPGWKSKQQMYFIDILVNIYRYYVDSQPVPAQRDQANESIIRVIEYILAHFREEVSMTKLIELSALGKTWFYTIFKQVTGVSPNHFIHRLRIQHSIELLHNTEKSITNIAYESGFLSLSYYNKIFKKFRGASPSLYRDRTKKMKV